jgi:hypothetical protein
MPSDRAGFRVSRRRALAIGGAAAASVLSARAVPGVGGSGSDAAPEAPPTADDSVGRVHELGITGGGVHVAVLDPTGFDPSHDALTGQIADIRQFGAENAVVEGTTHGTAAAAAVSSVAPDARLSLASFRKTGEFRAAVGWAAASGADVILAPVAAHGTAPSPRSPVVRAARNAVEAGCVVVAPTGNAALGHWQAPYAVLSDDSPDDRRLRLRPMPDADTVAGRFVAWLVADPSLRGDLTLSLLRAVDSGPDDRWDLIAVSRPVEGRPGRRLTADLTAGEYALVVRPTDAGSDPAADGDPTARVEVTTPTHALASPRPLGSIAAPASARGVVGVGVLGEADRRDTIPAGDSSGTATGIVAPYSGRGPTVRGDTGVDVVAPPRPWEAAGDPGTSAAAARTAAAATLVLDARPDLDPAGVTRVLRASAADVGRPGRDLSAGWGRLDIVAAVQRARAR